MKRKIEYQKKLSRDFFKEKKINTWYDKIWVKYLVKEIQKVDNEIGAFIFPNIKTIAFWYKNIIIYKILLNEENVDKIKIAEHKKKVEQVVRLLKLNLIPLKDLKTAARQVKNINFQFGRKLN